MKKYLFAIAVICCAACISCNSAGGASATAKMNSEANAAIDKMMMSGDFSKLGDYIADDAVDHSDKGDLKGLAAIKANLEELSKTSDNMKSVVKMDLANDEFTSTWYHWTGTWKVDGPGMKKGETYSMEAIEVSKWKDGKAVEHWTFMDPAEMMKMMSGTPPPAGGMEMKTDTVQKPASKM